MVRFPLKSCRLRKSAIFLKGEHTRLTPPHCWGRCSRYVQERTLHRTDLMALSTDQRGIVPLPGSAFLQHSSLLYFLGTS